MGIKAKIDNTIAPATDSKKPEFKYLIIDADTPIYKVAATVQEDSIIATNIKTNESKEFRNITEFHGKKKEVAEGWLGDVNRFLGTRYTRDDFEVVQKSIIPNSEEEAIEEAMTLFAFFVNRMKKLKIAKEIRLVFGAGGNYRYDEAKIIPYKGQRIEKPLLLEPIKEAIIKKYDDQVILAKGVEADDILGIYGKKNSNKFKKTGKWKACLAYCDKDLKQIHSPYIDYNNTSEGIHYPEEIECKRFFWYQMLAGDKSVDNIIGLPDVSAEFREVHGVRKGKGVGPKAAEKIIEDCETEEDMAQRVVDAYVDYYGVEEHKFVSEVDGAEYSYNYLDFMQENAILLAMQSKKGERFDIKKYLKKLKVDVR